MSARDPYEERERRLEEAEEERRAANPMLRAALITVAVLVALLFLGMLGRAFGLLRWGAGAEPAPTRELILGDPTPEPLLGGGDGLPAPDLAATVPPVGVPPTPPPEVSPTFGGFYEARGGMRALGLPIAPPQSVNGREVQWFERARVEHWPEHAGTPYEVQLGRLGAALLHNEARPDTIQPVPTPVPLP